MGVPIRLKLLPEYEASPVWWGQQPFGEVDVNTLPITNELKSEVLQWAQLYWATLCVEDPVRSGFPTLQTKEAFDRLGKLLWERLRGELGPAYIVQYFSVMDNKLHDQDAYLG